MPPSNKANMFTSFKCVPIKGETIGELAHNYEQIINRHIHNPEAQFVEEAGRHLYMRPLEYSFDKMKDGYVANITLVGTTNRPTNKVKHGNN